MVDEAVYKPTSKTLSVFPYLLLLRVNRPEAGQKEFYHRYHRYGLRPTRIAQMGGRQSV